MSNHRVHIGKTDAGLEPVILEGLEFIGWEEIIRPDAAVLIKPNLTYPRYKPGATTSPEMMEAVIRVLQRRTSRITICESDGGNHSYPVEVPFEGHGLPELARKYGVELLSLSRDDWEQVPVKCGLRTRSIPLSKRMLHDFDVTVNLPVPKMHFVVEYTGAIKNHWGLIPDTMRLRNHYFFTQAVFEIIRRTAPEIVIADGSRFMDINGPVRGEAVEMNLVVTANSPGAADMALTRIMGLDPARIFYLRRAMRRGWIPRALAEIDFNAPPDSFHTRDFHLERSLADWLATVGYHSKWMTRLVYESRFAESIHRLIRRLRKESPKPVEACHDCDIRPPKPVF